MGAGMSAWGASWGVSWGASWGQNDSAAGSGHGSTTNKRILAEDQEIMAIILCVLTVIDN